MVKAADKDGDGKISFDEFCRENRGKISEVLKKHEETVDDYYNHPTQVPSNVSVGDKDYKDPSIYKRIHYWSKIINVRKRLN